jgi:tripartite-type tricarboxylate transporter receptor subunit TctC
MLPPHGEEPAMTALFRRAVALLAALWVISSPAFAQGWPSKPVTLVVPWPAGGVADFIARQVQADVQKALGQPLIIENVGGVGGALGVQKVLGATDGHHALLGSPLELIIPPLTSATVKYKPADLRMVALLVKAPFVLIARKDLPAADVDELIALANRQKSKPLAMANTGPGSMFHLVGEKFAQLTGIELLHVPYKGATPAFTDLMGGQVDLMFAIFAGPVPGMVADGKFKVIGLATAQPLSKFPAIPVLAAHPKLAGFEFDSWAGIQVPRNTSDEVAQQLNKALYDAMQIPQTRQAFESVGNQVVPRTSLPDLNRLYGAEVARYGAIVKSINLQPQQ